MWRALMVLWGACALGAGVVEVEGEKVKLDREYPTAQPVEVASKLYTAAFGPSRGLVCVGQVRSRLPHDYFDVTVSVTVWGSYKDEVFPLGCMNVVGVATATFPRLKPGQVVRFAAAVKDKKGLPAPINTGHTHYSSVSVVFEKSARQLKELKP